MVNWLSSSDKDCRYLREDPTRPGEFLALATKLGITLPPDVKLIDAVRWGWVEPSLRVRLPDTFFLEWDNYPKRPRLGSLRPSDVWADELHDAVIIYWPSVQLDRNEDVNQWFVHPFDRSNSPETDVIRAHAISAAAEHEPNLIHHSSGVEIAPYIDFFPYWQVYRLAESIAAATLFKPVFNTPAAEKLIRMLIDELPRWREFSGHRIARIERESRQRENTFEWLSRYRTLLGAAVDADSNAREVALAAKEIAAGIAASADALKTEIRDVLLVLFQEWKWDLRSAHIGKPVVDYLRQDIKLAVDFVAEGTGVAAPLNDPVWTSDSRCEHLWARMDEALPYELERARDEFPFLASMYLADFAESVHVPALESRLEVLTRAWWSESYPFRRFTLLFHRLHGTLGGDTKERITFDEENTVDYLILCTLVAEKLMAWFWLREHSQPAELPGFKSLLLASLTRVAQSLKVEPPEEQFNALYSGTALYDLTTTRKLKFFESVSALEDERRLQWLVRTALNFAIMRNYAAHHECLDAELTYSESGNQALTAVTTLVVLLLSAATPSVGGA
jgi:hypothetical protein